MIKKKLNINVIGLGFVGLVTAVVLAKKGFEINAIENDSKRLVNTKRNQIDFEEPNIVENLKKFKNRIEFSNKEKIFHNKINVIFICVGTPSKRNGAIDLKYVYKVCENLKKFKREKIILVIKSTVLPGTAEFIKKKIFINNKNIYICSNPEFLREGSAFNDFLKSEKIVLGTDNKFTVKIMRQIYKDFNSQYILTNFTTAEFIKYLSNSLLASLISFSNFMSLLSTKVKTIDLKKSFEAVKLDKRWFGNPAQISSYFHPGIGYGGSCLPKDVNALSNYSSKFIKKDNLLHNFISINSIITKKMVLMAKNKIKNFKLKKIIFLGASFKPGSDDIRNSKSIEFIERFISKNNLKFEVYDEMVKKIKLNGRFRSLVRSKLKYNKDNFYILLTPWPNYIRFLKKIPKTNFIDVKYII
mgnify:FL=1